MNLPEAALPAIARDMLEPSVGIKRKNHSEDTWPTQMRDIIATEARADGMSGEL